MVQKCGLGLFFSPEPVCTSHTTHKDSDYVEMEDGLVQEWNWLLRWELFGLGLDDQPDDGISYSICKSFWTLGNMPKLSEFPIELIDLKKNVQMKSKWTQLFP